TRFKCDWSSDVCSSDLLVDVGIPQATRFSRLRTVHGFVRFGSARWWSPYETATTSMVASSSNSPPQNSVTRSSKKRCSASADSRSEERRVGDGCGYRKQ